MNKLIEEMFPFSYSCCFGLRFGSLHHCFNAAETKVHLGSFPAVERYPPLSNQNQLFNELTCYFPFLQRKTSETQEIAHLSIW